MAVSPDDFDGGDRLSPAGLLAVVILGAVFWGCIGLICWWLDA